MKKNAHDVNRSFTRYPVRPAVCAESHEQFLYYQLVSEGTSILAYPLASQSDQESGILAVLSQKEIRRLSVRELVAEKILIPF